MQFEACVDEWFDDHPAGRAGRAIHQVDGALAIGDPGIFVSAGKIEPQARHRLPGGFQFRAFHRGVEIQIDRRAIHDFGNLIVFIIVVENIAVQRQRAVEQRVLGTQLEGIDEFRLERKRMNRALRCRRGLNCWNIAPGGLAPPAL